MTYSPAPSDASGDGSKSKNLDQITFRFCSECSNMLYPKEDEVNHQLQFTCRTCQYSEAATSSCIYRNILNNSAGETAGVTQDVGSDPTVGNSSLAAQEMEEGETLHLLFCDHCGEPISSNDPQTENLARFHKIGDRLYHDAQSIQPGGVPIEIIYTPHTNKYDVKRMLLSGDPTLSRSAVEMLLSGNQDKWFEHSPLTELYDFDPEEDDWEPETPCESETSEMDIDFLPRNDFTLRLHTVSVS